MTDPNGFVIPVPKQPRAAAKAEAERRAAAAALLNNSGAGLFEKLMASANSSGKASSSTASSSTATKGAASSASGNGNGAPAAAATSSKPKSPQAVDPQQALAKAAFLQAHRREYGYNGLIDKLYATEVGCRMKPNEHYMDYTGARQSCSTACAACWHQRCLVDTHVARDA